MKEQIPPEITNLLDEAAKQYSQSKSTNNAGLVLRFIARFITPSTIIKLFAHKIINK